MGVAAASRGYHASGTETTRPSCNVTISASLVTFTLVAAAASAASAEVLMPGPLDGGLVLANQRRHLRQFRLRKPVVVLNPDGTDPELRRLALARYVDVSRFPRSLEKKNRRYGPLCRTVGLTRRLWQLRRPSATSSPANAFPLGRVRRPLLPRIVPTGVRRSSTGAAY